MPAMTTEITSIVKAMSHLAWADGVLDPREETMLTKFFLKLGLTEEEAKAALLRDSEPPDLQELARAIPGKPGRHKLIRLLMELSFADEALTFDEYHVIEKVTKVLEITEDELEELRQEILGSR